MTTATGTASGNRLLSGSAWRNLLRDYPLVPLSILLVLLIILAEIMQPGLVNQGWATATVRQAAILAILAGCQTLTMLTGGIDLSVGYVASMAGFVTATFVHQPGGWPMGVVVALAAAGLAGLVSGIGIGIFKVHPLIVTLGMGLVIFGFANVWQLQSVQTGAGVPTEIRTVGTGITAGVIPNDLFVFVPVAIVLILLLKRTGYGRMLYAIGDNPIAARLSGVRAWQVLVVLYVISGVLAGIAGLLQSGLSNTAAVTLVQPYLLPSVAAAVIGGTSILGGRGGYSGTIVGAVILTVLASVLGIVLPEPWRQVVFGSIVVLVAAAYARVTAEG